MVRNLIYFFTVLVVICLTNGCKQSDVKSNTSQFSISPTDSTDFYSAKNSILLIRDTLKYGGTPHKLKLPIFLKNKSYMQLNDTLYDSDDDGIRQYKYLGEYGDLGFYLVQAVFWEHSEDYLINKYSSEKTTIWEQPKFSPDKSLFADILQSGMDGEPIGIQIWKISKDHYNNKGYTVSPILELNQVIWEPIDFRWKDDKTIILKIHYLDENLMPIKSANKYLKLSLP